MNAGCATSFDFQVFLNPRQGVFIPNIFSPNQDGINDLFVIFPSSAVKNILYLQVYDRWGELVFERTNFSPNNHIQNGWDGSFNGKIMPPATFAFIGKIEYLDGTIEEVSGDITLIR